MHDSHSIRLVLHYLFTLAEHTQSASIGRIAGDLGLDRQQVARALLVLDRAGLADCARVRLTLAGLAVAVSARRRAAIPLAA